MQFKFFKKTTMKFTILSFACLSSLVFATACAKNNSSSSSESAKPASETSATPAQDAKAQAAFNFELVDEKGATVKLSDYAGKKVILNFWSSWCPPCKAEMPEFQKLHDELKNSKDTVLLTINLTDGQRETQKKAMNFMAENKYTMKVLFDTTQSAAMNYNIMSIPTTFIIDTKGNIVSRVDGMTTKANIESALQLIK